MESAGGQGRPPLRESYKCHGGAGRCGERTGRCQWQKQRSERVAAVKISSVRRKAAQKFWAPQQDHRPLRMRCRKCGEVGDRKGRPYGKRLPLSGEPLGVRIATTSLQTGLAMTGLCKRCGVRADVGIGPYGEVIDGAGCGRGRTPPLRRGYRGAAQRGIPQSRLRRASPL